MFCRIDCMHTGFRYIGMYNAALHVRICVVNSDGIPMVYIYICVNKGSAILQIISPLANAHFKHLMIFGAL